MCRHGRFAQIAFGHDLPTALRDTYFFYSALPAFSQRTHSVAHKMAPLPSEVAKMTRLKELAELKLAQILSSVGAGGASRAEKKKIERAKKAVERLRSRLRRSSGQLVENRTSAARRQAGSKADRRISDQRHLCRVVKGRINEQKCAQVLGR